jgi:hypothetical protein
VPKKFLFLTVVNTKEDETGGPGEEAQLDPRTEDTHVLRHEAFLPDKFLNLDF